MKFKFLILVAVAAMVLNAAAEEDMSSGVQNYYETEENLSSINTGIDTLNESIEKLEQEISPLNDRKESLTAEVEKKNSEFLDIENNIKNTQNDIENMESKKSEFDVNKGLAYRIGNMVPAFIVGLWVSIIILIFVWRGE